MPAKLTKKQIQEGLEQMPIDVLLTGTRNNRLTHKQKEFAKEVALGNTKAGAYRKAYNTKANKKVQANHGSALAMRDDIAMEIEAIKQAIEFNKSHSTAQLRALVVSQLTKEALNGDNPPASRLTALKALGEVAGVDAFIHRTETKVIRDSDSARNELMDQLKKVIGDNMRTVNEDDSDARELLAEISGAGIVNPAAQTPPGGHPLNVADSSANYIHSIPDNQSPEINGGVQNPPSVNFNTPEETPPYEKPNE
jgi:hypothetical protein